VPYQTFHAWDKPLVVAVGNNTQFANLCAAMGRPELAEDERYATNPDRVSNREALISELQQEFGKRTADEWVEKIRAAGVPSGPVNTLADVFADEHVLGSGMLQTLDHPSAGPLEMVASPLIVDGEHLPIRHAPPTLGQHTEEGWQR
jgi:glutaryl-CoA transferase